MVRRRIQRKTIYGVIALLMIGMFIWIINRGDHVVDYRKEYVKTNELLHNSNSFTEGLWIENQVIYESSGKYKQSFITKRDLNKKIDSKISLSEEYFAEGITIWRDKLYALTYKENKSFIINPESLKIEQELDYPKEGWGLTTDGQYLIASDGSSMLYYWDENFNLVKELKVTRSGKMMHNINELEYIEGKIWANIWMTNQIIIINPKNGKVEKTLDFSSLAKKHKKGSIEEVMNGIAYDSSTKKIYITGKNWETIYEIQRKD